MSRIPCQITTDVHHYDDGSHSREQTVTAPTMAKALAMYRLLAEIDAKVAAHDALERIGAIESH